MAKLMNKGSKLNRVIVATKTLRQLIEIHWLTHTWAKQDKETLVERFKELMMDKYKLEQGGSDDK